MTATKGLGTYGNAVGTVTPLDHKMANTVKWVHTAANTIRSGLIWDGTSNVVSGKADMSYDVRAFGAVTSRSATAGAVELTNDAVYNVVTTAAPGSNSRYDVVYVWQREYSLDGTNSNPVIGVVQGSAAASPTVPSLSAFPGAIELARILVPAGVVATNSGTTITQTAPFTVPAGGVVPFRNMTEMNAFTPSSQQQDQKAISLASMIIYRWNGSAWKPWESDWIAYTPTLAASAGSWVVGTGGSAQNSGWYKFDSGLLSLKGRQFFGSSGATVFTNTPHVLIPGGYTLTAPSLANEIMVSSLTIFDAGVASSEGLVRYQGTSVDRVSFASGRGSSVATITNTAPYTFGSGDGFAWQVEGLTLA